MLPTQLIPDEKEGKVLRVRFIQKEGKKLFDPVYLFDEGSTISWIPCGRKLTCSFPGIKFYYGPDTYYGEEVCLCRLLITSPLPSSHLMHREMCAPKECLSSILNFCTFSNICLKRDMQVFLRQRPQLKNVWEGGGTQRGCQTDDGIKKLGLLTQFGSFLLLIKHLQLADLGKHWGASILYSKHTKSCPSRVKRVGIVVSLGAISNE